MLIKLCLTTYYYEHIIVNMRLRAERKKRRWTQKELAEMVGVNQMTISAIESKKVKSPSWALVCRISEVMGLEPEFIFPVKPRKPAASRELRVGARTLFKEIDSGKEAGNGQQLKSADTCVESSG